MPRAGSGLPCPWPGSACASARAPRRPPSLGTIGDLRRLVLQELMDIGGGWVIDLDIQGFLDR
jgi:hypothetical protein